VALVFTASGHRAVAQTATLQDAVMFARPGV